MKRYEFPRDHTRREILRFCRDFTKYVGSPLRHLRGMLFADVLDLMDECAPFVVMWGAFTESDLMQRV